ncbi:MAG: AAA family ATPase [Clostridiales bacterium]|nr:AAA family ATPase [Clostridiales bacterium]
MKRFLSANAIKAYAVLLVTAGIIFAACMKTAERPEAVAYTEFLQMLEKGHVIEATLSDGAQFTFKALGGAYHITDNPRNPSLKEELLLKGVSVSEGSSTSAGDVAGSVLSAVFFCSVLVFVYKASNRQSPKSAMALNVQESTDQSRHFARFNDIAGNEEAKDSVSDIVDFLKNPEKYSRFGARMPRGVIFYGPPGTGKTLMAKAIAGEAEAPFYAVGGSDFVQMYVGVGAARIRELFQKAKNDGKAVIFIDEIDALGKKRSVGAQGGNDEREQALNALLTEMSGFSSEEGIVVIAATNRLDILDEALLRPGRFDRQVEIGLPDLQARKSILRLHQSNKPFSEEVDIDSLAKQTVFFSGAMLESLLNEAAIFAAKRLAEKIELEDVNKAYYTVLAGSEKKDRSGILELERRITAFHESGHALAAKLLCPASTVAKITIIPSSRGAGGFCVNIPPDKMFCTKKELKCQIMMNLAGRASEELFFGSENITTGASNDIEKSVALVKDYVTKYGMGESLMHTEASAHEECARLLDELYECAKSFLTCHKELLSSIAKELLEKESLNEDDLNRLVAAVTAA